MRKRTSGRNPAPLDLLSLLSGWTQRGFGNPASTQQVLGGPALPHNAAALKASQQPSPLAPAMTFITDLAGEGASSFIEAQKILLHLAQQQNEILMKGIKERVAGSRAVAMIDLVHRSLDTMLRLQQDFLRTTHKQTLQWLEAIRSNDSSAHHDLVHLAREAVERFVEAQSDFLNVIAEEIRKAGRPGQHKTARTAHKTELSKLAREATNAFIEAQEKLMNVVGRQIASPVKLATRTIDLASPARYLPIANAAGDAIADFVSAEKALIEATVHPRKPPKVVSMPQNRARHTDYSRKAGAGG
jgi:hypothetical protein